MKYGHTTVNAEFCERINGADRFEEHAIHHYKLIGKF